MAEGAKSDVEYRWAEGKYDRLYAIAADLVRRSKVYGNCGGSTAATLQAAGATALGITPRNSFHSMRSGRFKGFSIAMRSRLTPKWASRRM